jgi:hypothetical protein
MLQLTAQEAASAPDPANSTSEAILSVRSHCSLHYFQGLTKRCHSTICSEPWFFIVAAQMYTYSNMFKPAPTVEHCQ